MLIKSIISAVGNTIHTTNIGRLKDGRKIVVSSFKCNNKTLNTTFAFLDNHNTRLILKNRNTETDKFIKS